MFQNREFIKIQQVLSLSNKPSYFSNWPKWAKTYNFIIFGMIRLISRVREKRFSRRNWSAESLYFLSILALRFSSTEFSKLNRKVLFLYLKILITWAKTRRYSCESESFENLYQNELKMVVRARFDRKLQESSGSKAERSLV